MIADLESALELNPHHEKVQRLLVETRLAERADLESKIETEAAEKFTDIDRFIADGETQGALTALDEAIALFGDFPKARALRRRLEAQLRS